MLNLKIARISSKLTQAELGEKIGLTKVDISRYETGKVKPGLVTLCKLADTLNVTVDYLIGRENKE
ncbi:helix-turn-helix domain-containing protein [Clostridium brassicae]|uniref:Helix-turn-helix transcriptional regulator n=1 Tax=Clostridium brassicae TaxID=2999072 RepID=A0ABT4D9X3_9CLOT|nr:helix-turn-helix transcriptional regulator [Clostridium brassicae]MCY6957829.1 helix-turn-helix transcriptional regulator [Clostridium brassicae]